MGRKRVLGKIELKFIKESGDIDYSINTKCECRDEKYLDDIEKIYECITRVLKKLVQHNEGKK
jgi:hypothetical protein